MIQSEVFLSQKTKILLFLYFRLNQFQRQRQRQWSALCNLLLLGVESLEFLESSHTFNRLLHIFWVACSAVASPWLQSWGWAQGSRAQLHCIECIVQRKPWSVLTEQKQSQWHWEPFIDLVTQFTTPDKLRNSIHEFTRLLVYFLQALIMWRCTKIDKYQVCPLTHATLCNWRQWPQYNMCSGWCTRHPQASRNKSPL